MSTRNFFLRCILALTSLALVSCRDHVLDGPPNEEELITTLRLSFTELDEAAEPVGDPVHFFWRDVDASGDPTIDEVVLKAHRAYLFEIAVLDESRTPAVDITSQIVEEALEHQFFFQVSGYDAVIVYNDSDAAGKPLGVENAVKIGQPGAGNLTVVLRHEPDKNAPGVSAGNILNAGGETDIEAVFPFSVIDQ